jgi:hypothetical protein
MMPVDSGEIAAQIGLRRRWVKRYDGGGDRLARM